MRQLYFIGSYKNSLHYTDGFSVFSSSDYKWGYRPVMTFEELSSSDNFYELAKDEAVTYCPSYKDLPSLISVYKIEGDKENNETEK